MDSGYKRRIFRSSERVDLQIDQSGRIKSNKYSENFLEIRLTKASSEKDKNVGKMIVEQSMVENESQLPIFPWLILQGTLSDT